MFNGIRELLEWLVHFLWPIAKVQEWEKAGIYRRGRFRRVVGPGLYFVVPWFDEVIAVDMRTAFAGTVRRDLTLQDGSVLTYEAAMRVRVADPAVVLNEVDDYRETLAENAAAILGERLALMKAERLMPEKRAALFDSLENAVAKEAEKIGLTVEDLYFPSFVLNVRTYRILGNEAASPW